MTDNTEPLPALVERMEPQFKKALGGAVPSERFTRIAISTINTNPDVAGCNRASLLKAIMQAAQDGLVIDGREAAVVKHNTKNGPVATYIPMVGGLVKKMRQHPEFSNISHGIIYSREVESGAFEFIKGDHESLRHRPMMFGDRGNPLGAYAVLTTKDGSQFRAVLTREEIEKRRDAGRAGDRGPWGSWREEMWIKTALRALYKIAPNSGDVSGVLDGVFDREEAPDVVDDTPSTPDAAAADGPKPKPRGVNRARAAVVPESDPARNEPAGDIEDAVQVQPEHDESGPFDPDDVPV